MQEVGLEWKNWPKILWHSHRKCKRKGQETEKSLGQGEGSRVLCLGLGVRRNMGLPGDSRCLNGGVH